MGYLTPKLSLWKVSCSTITAGEDKRVHFFPKGISLKVNVIAWLEFELTHYNILVHVSHYTMRTPLFIHSGLISFIRLIPIITIIYEEVLDGREGI